jgi:hypothetical protein
MRALALATIAILGCSKPGDEEVAKRTPIPPPPAELRVPADLHVDVTVDGAAAAPITATALGQVHPDFSDDEHRAWKLSTLVPAFARDGAVIEARGQGGIALELDRPASPSAPQPVLFLTRRGGVAVTVLDPANPFPGFHGQGGRLRRQGAETPRIEPVVALAVNAKRP